MLDRMKLLAVGVAGGLLTACAAAPGPGEADRVFIGTVYTGVEGAPRAEAVAVKNGRVLAVGAEADLRALAGPHTDRIELGEAALYPGFTDAHAHLFGVGLREVTLNLEGVASIAELQEALRPRVEAAEAGATITGRGWIETHWPEGRFPNKGDLDAVSGDTPVVLRRADGHALVANTAALRAAGIDADTADPPGGQIVRDAAGEPTGILIDKAMALMAGIVTAPAGEARTAILAEGARVTAAYGWTGVHNMSVAWEDVARMEALAETGELPVRVYNAIDPVEEGELLVVGGYDHVSGRVTTRAVKLYMDGALGSRGALLLASYADADGIGLQLREREATVALFETALRDGVQLCVHAIGDRANRLALDWMEAAFAAVPPEDRPPGEPRWRIEHSQILDPADIDRFAELGVIASMQPSHAIGDLHFAPNRLGLARLIGAYAWRSLIDSGAVIAGGSDAPVERGDPLIEFYAAVARRDLEGFQGEGWRPEEAVTRAEALKLFTLWPAYAAFQEDELGTIEVGKRADFSVFSADLMTIPHADIPAQSVVMTVVDGDIAYDGRPAGEDG
ncbi:MAG: amidohydrolase [Caulobacterales bacterium]|nr:amidohydrolase [Caulobacterales bacterium]